MSLRFRLALLFTLAVGANTLFAWLASGRAIIRPLAREMLEGQVRRAVEAVERLEDGVPLPKVERKFELDLKYSQKLPFRPGAGRCEARQIDERRVIACRGRRVPVAVQSGARWVIARRDLDLERPGRELAGFLVISSALVLLLSLYLASLSTRPLQKTALAMRRVAGGELRHRLPPEGPRELREVAEAFNAMTDRVSEMLEAERRLMAGISHELRTPLARLRLTTELLRDAGVDPKRLGAMEVDLAECDLLIGELLESSRLAIGERALTVEPIELAELAELARTRAGLEPARVTIEGRSGPLYGDAERLIRVLSNLFDNAAKYGGEAPIEVSIQGGVLEVQDRGPGVAPESLSRLFDPFFREPGALGKKPGLGLGLMIAKQIVLLHGGTIEATNRLGGGLVVRVELPAGQPPRN